MPFRFHRTDLYKDGYPSARLCMALASLASTLVLTFSLTAIAGEHSDNAKWRISCVEDGRTLYLEELREPPASDYSDKIAGRFPDALCMVAPLYDVVISGRSIFVTDEDLDSLASLDEVKIEGPFHDTRILDDASLEQAIRTIFGDLDDVRILSGETDETALFGTINTPADDIVLFSRNTGAGHYVKDNDFFWSPPPGYWLLSENTAEPTHGEDDVFTDNDIFWTPPPGYWSFDQVNRATDDVEHQDNDSLWEPPPGYWMFGDTTVGTPDPQDNDMLWIAPPGYWLLDEEQQTLKRSPQENRRLATAED